MQLQYLRCSTFRGMERFWNENRLSLWYVLRNETVFRDKMVYLQGLSRLTSLNEVRRRIESKALNPSHLRHEIRRFFGLSN